jgi:hypothetical protein
MSSRNTPARLALTLLAIAAIGCDSGDSTNGSVDALTDTDPNLDLGGGETDTDSPVADTSTPDTTLPDTTVPVDALADTTPDATPDITSDAIADATPDITSDAIADTTPDTTTDTTTVADTTPVADTSPDVTTDTAADTTPDPCAEDCLAVGPGPTGVTITNNATAEAPTLSGLAASSGLIAGDFELQAIAVYTKGAFNAVFIQSATVADDGETSGTVTFEGDRWAFFLDLDLVFTAQTVLGPNTGGSRNQITGGGCFAIAGNQLVTDAAACSAGWPEGTTPPDEFEFTYDSTSGRFILKVILTREFITALLPPEYQSLAGVAITGPIRFIASFAPAP